ncbi:hypothetical protein MAR_032741 [Mya arenaria]|uniref:Uncharacterized protein n=1 Tax=Mya arenaria TaxID=6604 RepID=A0ABY7FAX2_MYAAR|nr:hypothetical protein MAR_032741 [Mya arenaria]
MNGAVKSSGYKFPRQQHFKNMDSPFSLRFYNNITDLGGEFFMQNKRFLKHAHDNCPNCFISRLVNYKMTS